MNSKFKIVKKYVDEYDYYGLLRDGAPDDEFISEALRISATHTLHSSLKGTHSTVVTAPILVSFKKCIQTVIH